MDIQPNNDKNTETVKFRPIKKTFLKDQENENTREEKTLGDINLTQSYLRSV